MEAGRDGSFSDGQRNVESWVNVTVVFSGPARAATTTAGAKKLYALKEVRLFDLRQDRDDPATGSRPGLCTPARRIVNMHMAGMTFTFVA